MNQLTTGVTPFNVFARIAAGVMQQPDMDKEQEHLGDFKDQFCICKNRPENDEHWDSDDAAWVGKASMSRRHRFLATKDLHWQWFNALSFGMVPTGEEGEIDIKAAVEHVELMKAAALTYAGAAEGWSDKVGLCLHVFGHNSVNALHVHIVDMTELGPSFWSLERKNCPLDAVLKVLQEEFEAKKEHRLSPVTEVTTAARAAAEAATSAKEALQALKKSTSIFSTGVFSSNVDEILELNVGGETLSVPRSTLLLAPAGSRLNDLFSGNWSDGGVLHHDCHGRIFLNFPPTGFRLIVNHLRLLHNSSNEDVLAPIVVPRENQHEVEELSWLLGVSSLLNSPQTGVCQGLSRSRVPGHVSGLLVAGAAACEGVARKRRPREVPGRRVQPSCAHSLANRAWLGLQAAASSPLVLDQRVSFIQTTTCALSQV